MANIVFVDQRYMLFLQNLGETDKHKHDTCHLTISLNGKMHCLIQNEIKDCYGYILNSTVFHQRFGENADSFKLVFVFEPCVSALLSSNNRILQNKNFVELTKHQYDEILEIIKLVLGENYKDIIWADYLKENLAQLKDMINRILEICGISLNNKLEMDQRIETAIRLMDQIETIDNNTTDDLCKSVCLSKSRFLHLFKASTGISLKKYMQYMKFFKTWKYIAEGENITKACIHAGYNDSAHYSNFMSQCYGLSTKQELSSIVGVYSLY